MKRASLAARRRQIVLYSPACARCRADLPCRHPSPWQGIVHDRLGDFPAAVARFTSAIELEPGNADFYHVGMQGSTSKRGGYAAVQQHTPVVYRTCLPSPAHAPSASLAPLCLLVPPSEPRVLAAQDGAVRGCSARLQRSRAGGVPCSDPALPCPLPRSARYPALPAACCRPSTLHQPPFSLRLPCTLQLNPSHSKAYYNRAVALERLRRYEAAAEDYGAVLVLDPRNAPAHQNRGALWLRLGRLQVSAECRGGCCAALGCVLAPSVWCAGGAGRGMVLTLHYHRRPCCCRAAPRNR